MIKPLNGHLLIQVDTKSDVTKSGIILTKQEDSRMEKAKVIAVSEELKSEKIKKGDIVYYKTYSLSPVEIEGEEFNFIKYEELLGMD